MNTLYEKLRKRVYEILYPDWIPLEFGCEVEIAHGSAIFIGEFESEGCGAFKLADGSDIIEVYGEWKTSLDIIGKPLSLSDLLRAMNTVRKSGTFFMIGIEGAFYDIDAKPCPFYLNLSLPMSEQTDEVLKKLNALLV